MARSARSTWIWPRLRCVHAFSTFLRCVGMRECSCACRNDLQACFAALDHALASPPHSRRKPRHGRDNAHNTCKWMLSRRRVAEIWHRWGHVEQGPCCLQTEMCRSWEETGSCRYGRKCQVCVLSLLSVCPNAQPACAVCVMWSYPLPPWPYPCSSATEHRTSGLTHVQAHVVLVCPSLPMAILPHNHPWPALARPRLRAHSRHRLTI